MVKHRPWSWMLAKSTLPPGAKLTPVNSEVLKRLRANGVTLPSVSTATTCWTPSPSSARKNPPYGDTQMLSGPSGVSEAGCGLTGTRQAHDPSPLTQVGRPDGPNNVRPVYAAEVARRRRAVNQRV